MYLFTFTSPSPSSLSDYSIPFISVCRAFFFSFLFSFSSFFFRFCPSSVIASPYSILFVPFSIFGPFSLFFPSYFSLFIYPLSVSLLYMLYSSVFIFTHIPLFRFLYCTPFHFFLVSLCSHPARHVNMYKWQQSCRRCSTVNRQTSYISNRFYNGCTTCRSRPPVTLKISANSFKSPNSLT